MEIGEELMTWLKNKGKEYTACLEFAIKVWQSVDFVYINKYEVICKWLSQTLSIESTNHGELPVEQLKQLFGLRAQPGLVSVATKTKLIKVILKRIKNVKEKTKSANSRAHPELLQSLINFELVQDALRADYNVLMSSYGILFTSYERQLLCPTEGETELRHADFILPLLQQLRDYVQRAQHHKRLIQAYTKFALQPLCQLLLQLREHGLCCFEQLAALEQQLTAEQAIKDDVQRISEQPLHVRLLLLEAALHNCRTDPQKQSKLIRYAFRMPVINPLEQPLALATHALESLRKHNISLQFQMHDTLTGMEFVTQKLFKLIEYHKGRHLREVLMMLCAALRLNPLLLEPNVYQITVWMLTAPKCQDTELCLYADFLVQLLDMFRRLSRTERFVMQLLKSLREWLRNYELKLTSTSSSSNCSSSDPKRQCLSLPTDVDDTPPQLHDPYVELLLKPHRSVSSVSTDRLAQTWPSQTAGAAFTRLISHLMAKPSIVIWKMLLHTFSELLEPDTVAVLPVNLSFAIELQVALLCQYLMGTRLAEQVQQHQQELQQLRQHTAQVLQQFGRHLLAREHNRSTMNAFLECVDRATSFDLLLMYYWPDGLAKPTQQLQLPYKFLPSDEWELIQQRVHNFGKSSCRQRLQRLELQLAQTSWLLESNQRLEPCPDALVELVPRQLLSHLSRDQKQLRLQRQRCQAPASLLEDAECVQLLAMQLLQDYADSLKATKIKHTLLPKQLQSESELELELDDLSLSAALRQHCGSSKQPTLPLEATVQLIEALQQLPLAQLMSSIKLRLWLLIFTLYHDVRRGQLLEQAQQLLDQLIDLLHFGQPLPICSHFPQLTELLQLVPIVSSDASNGWRFYEMLFARCIRRLTPGTDNFLASCADHFREQLQHSQTLESLESRLLLLAIETLSSATGTQARRMQRHLQPLLEIYGQFVAHKFRSAKKLPSDAAEFVQQTISGFAVYLSSCINRAAKQQRERQQQQKEEKQPEQEEKQPEQEEQLEEKELQCPSSSLTATPIDENLRRICKIYIGHSLNYRNVHAIRLLNVALTHREQLHLDQDEIEFLLDSYWRQLNADIAAATLDIQSIEPAIKLIIGYKTNEDFLLLLRRLATQVEGMQRPETEAQHTSLQNVLILLQLFSKCSLSSIKGAMLNEHFELLSGNISLRLPGVGDATYRNHVLRLLEAQRALASNRTVPLTGETLDTMLGTMLDMNIKRFIISGGNLDDFLLLHAAISENLLHLLRQHGALMSDRAAQLTALCQDLIEAIVCYRSDRKQAQNLNDRELDGLSELALKVVTLFAGIAAGPQALAVKRVAPFLLIFAIKQMVTTERPTTLFEKIKVHLDRICHELISMCDHRAGHFILRSSNEAGARMYQTLVKEHDKYHKFRGKV